MLEALVLSTFATENARKDLSLHYSINHPVRGRSRGTQDKRKANVKESRSSIHASVLCVWGRLCERGRLLNRGVYHPIKQSLSDGRIEIGRLLLRMIILGLDLK